MACAEAAPASAPQHAARPVTPDEIRLNLPSKKDSFIERADQGRKPSGFSIRGTKGYDWTAAQFMTVIPVLARYKMNFLMMGYESFFSQPMTSDHSIPLKNEWWLPFPDAVKKGYSQAFAACRKYGIDACFCLNPQLDSPRPLDPTSEKDFDAIYPHYAWAQSAGVRWFSVCLDDVSGVTVDPAQHAFFVNKLIKRLRVQDPGAQMVFCPTYYAGDGTSPAQKKYLKGLAKNLDPSVYVFWTGPSVVPQTCTKQDAETFKNIVQHKVILWDNYPVNDGTMALHLAPITGRDPDLYKVVDGYMANPFFSQIKVCRIPLFTMADYAYDPQEYDPQESIGQAILHQTDNPKQRLALLHLVELYAGPIGSTGEDFAYTRYEQMTASPYSRSVAALYLQYVQSVQKEFEKAFPHDYDATKISVNHTIQWMQQSYEKKYGGGSGASGAGKRSTASEPPSPR